MRYCPFASQQAISNNKASIHGVILEIKSSRFRDNVNEKYLMQLQIHLIWFHYIFFLGGGESYMNKSSVLLTIQQIRYFTTENCASWNRTNVCESFGGINDLFHAFTYCLYLQDRNWGGREFAFFLHSFVIIWKFRSLYFQVMY